MKLFKSIVFWSFVFLYFSFWLLLGYAGWQHFHAYGPITGALLSGFAGVCVFMVGIAGFETVQSWDRGPTYYR